MSKASSLKRQWASEIKREIDSLNKQLREKKAELKELKDTPDSLIERLRSRFSSPTATASPVKKKKKQGKGSRPRLTEAETKVLTDGMLAALKGGEWVGAKNLKAAFVKLPKAGSRYNAIRDELIESGKIIKRGEKVNTEYKLKS